MFLYTSIQRRSPRTYLANILQQHITHIHESLHAVLHARPLRPVKLAIPGRDLAGDAFLKAFARDEVDACLCVCERGN